MGGPTGRRCQTETRKDLLTGASERKQTEAVENETANAEMKNGSDAGRMTIIKMKVEIESAASRDVSTP